MTAMTNGHRFTPEPTNAERETAFVASLEAIDRHLRSVRRGIIIGCVLLLTLTVELLLRLVGVGG